MTIEIIAKVKELAASGISKKTICKQTKLSWFSVYTILTGKKYPYKKGKNKAILLRGLSIDHKKQLRNIAKNKDVSQNRLLLSYVRECMNKESERNKIYED